MVVGHTPSLSVPGTEPGQFIRKCHDRLIGVDIGVAPYMGGHCNWLEIDHGSKRNVYGNEEKLLVGAH